MRYVAIDIETTGLDPDQHQIIEIGAVYDDLMGCTSSNTFQVCVAHASVVGSLRAINMNAGLLQEIEMLLALEKEGRKDSRLVRPGQVTEQFRRWLVSLDIPPDIPITLAGKNAAGFDVPFLKKLPHWNQYVRSNRRIIDPGTLYLRPDDDVVPDLKTCMERAGLPMAREHRALDDAQAVVSLIRHYFLGGYRVYDIQ